MKETKTTQVGWRHVASEREGKKKVNVDKWRPAGRQQISQGGDGGGGQEEPLTKSKAAF